MRTTSHSSNANTENEVRGDSRWEDLGSFRKAWTCGGSKLPRFEEGAKGGLVFAGDKWSVTEERFQLRPSGKSGQGIKGKRRGRAGSWASPNGVGHLSRREPVSQNISRPPARASQQQTSISSHAPPHELGRGLIHINYLMVCLRSFTILGPTARPRSHLPGA
jgi:hypothetical protein